MTIAESLCAVMMQILWFLLVFPYVDQTGELLGHQSIGIKAIYFAVDQRQVPGMTPLPCTLTLEVAECSLSGSCTMRVLQHDKQGGGI
jgi:hypothetical protein